MWTTLTTNTGFDDSHHIETIIGRVGESKKTYEIVLGNFSIMTFLKPLLLNSWSQYLLCASRYLIYL